MALSLEQIRNRVREYARNDGKVDDKEFGALKDEIGGDDGEVVLPDGTKVKWKEFINSQASAVQAGEALDPNAALDQQLGNLLKDVPTETVALEQLRSELAAAEKNLKEATVDAEKAKFAKTTNELQQKVALMEGKLQGKLERAQDIARMIGKESDINPEWKKAAGMSNGKGAATATLAMTAGKAQTAPNGGSNGGGVGVNAGKAAGFQPPASWSAQTAAGPEFNSSAFLQSQAASDYMLGSLDQVMQNQNRGKQLMMLFHYFAQRAASGDMGQMYQFMKFLTYIISKDKAKQQIDMGRKLIELQDESRKVTDILMNSKTDASDPNSNNDFMKTMTWAKSQSDAIATSQKLIAQMMEEFAQIVETLTNTTKGALETYGRILRTVSQIR